MKKLSFFILILLTSIGVAKEITNIKWNKSVAKDKKIRKLEKVLGSNKKEPCVIEKKNAIGMRRSLVAKIEIQKGSVISEEMITFKRPSTGIPPKDISKVLGKKATTIIPADTLIDWDTIN